MKWTLFVRCGFLRKRKACFYDESLRYEFFVHFFFFLLHHCCNISHTYCIIYLANVCTGTAGLRLMYKNNTLNPIVLPIHAPTESRRRDLWMHCWHFLMAEIFSHFPGVIPPRWRPLVLYFIYIFWVFLFFTFMSHRGIRIVCRWRLTKKNFKLFRGK